MRFAKAAPEAREQRKQAGNWLKQLRADAGLSQVDLAGRLGLKYYTFISQVENGFGRVPTVVYLGGAALEGPRYIWWNFVSSSRERIETAKEDWKQGRFAPVPEESEFIPLPE